MGPAAGLLDGLLASTRVLGRPGAYALGLDVLIHAACAQGGLLVNRDGAVLVSLGLDRTSVAALADAARGPLPRCLDSARLVHGSGVITYTSLGLPLDRGALLILADTDGAEHRVDIDAMLAVLPGVTCAMQVAAHDGMAA